MAFVKYENLTTPDEVIEKIHDYVKTVGSTVSDPLRGDTDIFTRTENDGKRFTFQDNRQEYYVTLRSANGTQIFGVNDDAEQDVKQVEKHKGYHGIGMVVSEGYSKTQRWYNQFNVPLKFKDKEVQGVWMPVSTGLEDLEEVKKPDDVEEPAPQEAPKIDYSPVDAIPKVEPPNRPYMPKFDDITFIEFRSLDSTVDAIRGDRSNAGITKIATTPNKVYHRISRNRIANSSALNGGSGIVRYTAIGAFQTEPKLTKIGNFYVVFSEYMGNMTYAGANVFSYYYNCPYELNQSILDECTLVVRDKTTGQLREATVKEINANKDNFTLPISTDTLSNTPLSTSNYAGNIADNYAYFGTVPKHNAVFWIKYKNRYIGYNELFTSYPGQLDHSREGEKKFKVQGASLMAYVLEEETYNFIKQANEELYKYFDTGTNKAKEKYEKDLATYETDLAKYKAYLEQVAALRKQIEDAYAKALAEYNKYLAKVAKYKEFLRLKALYDEYLKKVEELKNTYTLYCNHIIAPSETFLFSLVKQNKHDKRFFQTTHLAFGTLVKYEAWNGGAWFSGSANRHMMQTAYLTYADDDIISDRFTRPLLSSGEETTTFVRCDIDEAPLDIRGHVLWASSGTDNVTGKKLSLPIRTGDNMNGVIPNYRYMQSLGRLEWGRNINTLNGITVDMPIFFAVKVDPEELDLYAAIGHATGIYFLCMLNMQTAGVYERSYPKSGIQNQVFSVGRRRGNWGFDGIGIAQEDTVKE